MNVSRTQIAVVGSSWSARAEVREACPYLSSHPPGSWRLCCVRGFSSRVYFRTKGGPRSHSGVGALGHIVGSLLSQLAGVWSPKVGSFISDVRAVADRAKDSCTVSLSLNCVRS